MAEIIPIRWPRPGEAPEPDKIAMAAARIRRGEIIAIPTDTLYCLIADPFNLSAVSRVYRAKSRPHDRSLPMFVASIDQAAEMAQHLPSIFYLLAHRYWPGPLSMIVEAGGTVPLKATGNTRRLSLRQPKSAIAAALLAEMGTPLIATSANISGHSTCGTAAETSLALGDSVSLIFEAETSESAPRVESVQLSDSLIIDTPTLSPLPAPASPYPYAAVPTATTIDLTTPAWRLIREGVVSEVELREFLGG
ncbi:MAG: Sua5/YciO/YrdC/YwlC family protein [Acidobacteria bacterium]|nr:Sua5/YciO/YrdC/YwlC family protein [Acidobacteriota bacterium]